MGLITTFHHIPHDILQTIVTVFSNYDFYFYQISSNPSLLFQITLLAECRINSCFTNPRILTNTSYPKSSKGVILSSEVNYFQSITL